MASFIGLLYTLAQLAVAGALVVVQLCSDGAAAVLRKLQLADRALRAPAPADDAHAAASNGVDQALANFELPGGCKVCVFGSGSFGTALAVQFARRGYAVTMLARQQEVCDSINSKRRNPRAFPDTELPPNIHGTTDAAEALRGAKLAVSAVPVQATFDYFRRLRGLLTVPVLAASKGITRDTLQLVNDVIRDALTPDSDDAAAASGATTTPASRAGSGAGSPDTPASRPETAPSRTGGGQGALSSLLSPSAARASRGSATAGAAAAVPPVAVFSGPTFAKELIDGFPTGAVVACGDIGVAREIARAMQAAGQLRVFVTDDVAGVELCGALKNVYAIGAGAITGVGWQNNTTALFLTRAVAEMGRMARALGAREETLLGLAGWGDFALTAYGAASRNRSVGVRLGKGESLASILGSMSEVAEGVATAPAVRELARRLGVRAHIAEAVANVLDGSEEPLPAMMRLLALPTDTERGSAQAQAHAGTGLQAEPASASQGKAAAAASSETRQRARQQA